jgi:hypothetical protein
MTLGVYQFSFNGLTFGAGTPWVVESVEGLESMAPLRTQDEIRGYSDGQWSGRDFYDGRVVTFTIVTLGNATSSAQSYYRSLRQALSPQQLGYYPDAYADATGGTQPDGTLGLFQFKLNAESVSGDTSINGVKRMWGRVRSFETDVTPEYSYGYITSTVEMYFPDPRFYDDTLVTTTATSGSNVTIPNNGWATSCPLVVIASPASSGNLVSTSLTGEHQTMNFDNVSGSPLVIDLLTKSIFIGGGSGTGTYARNTLSGFNYWLDVPPPLPTSLTTFSSTLGNMTVYSRNAYL